MRSFESRIERPVDHRERPLRTTFDPAAYRAALQAAKAADTQPSKTAARLKALKDASEAPQSEH